MKFLPPLTPAESILIAHAKGTDFIDLLLYTLMDLYLRGVVDIKIGTRMIARSPRREIIVHVVPGKHFEGHQALPHEAIFLTPIKNQPAQRITLAQLVRKVYNAGKGFGKLKKKIISIPRVAHFFGYSLFGGIRLTKAGKQAKAEILDFLDPLWPQAFAIPKMEKEYVIYHLLMVRGDMSQLNEDTFKLFKRLERQFMAEERIAHKSGVNSEYDDDGVFGTY